MNTQRTYKSFGNDFSIFNTILSIINLPIVMDVFFGVCLVLLPTFITTEVYMFSMISLVFVSFYIQRKFIYNKVAIFKMNSNIRKEVGFWLGITLIICLLTALFTFVIPGKTDKQMNLFVYALFIQPNILMWVNVLFAPIIEEILYRNMLMGVFPFRKNIYYFMLAMLTQSLIFTFMHATQYENDLSTLTLIFIDAIILGLIRIYRNDILSSIITHVLMIFFGLLMFVYSSAYHPWLYYKM